MRFAPRSWWYLVGAGLAPLVLLVCLLEGYSALRLDLWPGVDLRLWLWCSWGASLAVGLFCVWRLPMHWFLRREATIVYGGAVGFYLLMAATRFAASLE